MTDLDAATLLKHLFSAASKHKWSAVDDVVQAINTAGGIDVVLYQLPVDSKQQLKSLLEKILLVVPSDAPLRWYKNDAIRDDIKAWLGSLE